MIDCSKAYRTALYSVLNGKVKINNVAIPVYNYVPETVSYPYIHIHSQTTDENGCKDKYGYVHMCNIDIVTGSVGDYGEDEPAENICNEILRLIMVKKHPFILSGFNHVGIDIDTIGNFEEQREFGFINYKVLRLKSIIFEM